MQDIEVWIEAEHWAPGVWQSHYEITDVIVTLTDGTRWVATFCAFAHIETPPCNYAEG